MLFKISYCISCLIDLCIGWPTVERISRYQGLSVKKDRIT